MTLVFVGTQSECDQWKRDGKAAGATEVCRGPAWNPQTSRVILQDEVQTLSHGTQGPTWSMLILYPTPSAWPLSLSLGSHSIWNPRYLIVYLQVAHMHMALWPLAFLTSCSFCLEHSSLLRMAAWASFPLGSPMDLPSSSHSTEKVVCPCGVLL